MPGSSISHVNTYNMSEWPQDKIAALEAERGLLRSMLRAKGLCAVAAGEEVLALRAERDGLKKALREVTECFIEASIELRGVYRELSRSQAAKDGVEP